MTHQEYQDALEQRQLDENIARTQLDALGGDELAAQQLQANIFPGRLTALPSSFNGSTTPPPQQLADQAQRLDEPRLRALAGWAEPPEQGGLGLAGQSQRTTSLPNNDALSPGAQAAQDLNDFMGNLPFWTRQNFKAHGGVNVFLSQAMDARQSQALKLQQLEETKKRHRQQMFLDVMTKPGLSETQRQDLLKPFADEDPLFRTAIEGIGKKRIGKMDSYLKLYPEEVTQLEQDWKTGKLTSDDIDQRLTMLDDRTKRRAASAAEASEYARLGKLAEQAIQTGTPMDAEDHRLFMELQTKYAKQQEELQAIRLKNELAQKKVDNPQADVKPTQMAEELSQILFDKPWAQLTQTERAAVGQEKERRLQARTSTMITQGLTAPLEKQANYYTRAGLDNLTLEQAPPNLTQEQYNKGPYRHLDAAEAEAVTQYSVAKKTVATMNAVADKLLTATTTAQAIKQKAALEFGAITGKNGLAAAYKADRDAFSSRMARLVEVGVLTNTDVSRWSDTFGSFGDTVQTLQAKQVLFGEIQNETERLLKLRLGGKPITTELRSNLDRLLNKADQYRSVDKDFETVFGGKP